jgi:hypothetical protein
MTARAQRYPWDRPEFASSIVVVEDDDQHGIIFDCHLLQLQPQEDQLLVFGNKSSTRVRIFIYLLIRVYYRFLGKTERDIEQSD